jgi:hypothetical protein
MRAVWAARMLRLFRLCWCRFGVLAPSTAFLDVFEFDALAEFRGLHPGFLKRSEFSFRSGAKLPAMAF